MHVIAAKAVCLKEALQPEFKEYARLVVEYAEDVRLSYEELQKTVGDVMVDDHSSIALSVQKKVTDPATQVDAVTGAATTTNCTMIRMRIGMVLRISEIMTFENAVITVTAKPMTIAGLSCEVTAKALQMPSTCTMIGLFRWSGSIKAALFCFENKLIVLHIT